MGVIGTIAAWLQRRARSSAGPALVDAADGSTLSWSDLAASAAAWAELASNRGLPPAARVALVVEDPLAFAAAWFGVLANGLAVVPLDPRAPAPELELALRRSRARVLAADRCGLELDGGGSWLLERWRVDRKQPQLVGAAATPPPQTSSIAVAALLLSSGTTGTPKGIPLAETQLVAAARRIATHHELTPLDRCYSPLPLFHVNAQVVGLLSALASGAGLVLDRRFDAGRYWEVVDAFRPTWLNLVPAMIGALNRLPAPGTQAAGRIRFARSASTALPVEALRRFEELTGIGVLETYGMTEAASQVAANPLDPARRRPGSVGLPVGLDLRVVLAEEPASGGEALPSVACATVPAGSGPLATRAVRAAEPGEPGVVQLRGAGVVEHYLIEHGGREELAPARGAGGWLTTGDLGTLDADGYLWLAGRNDDVINRGGEKFHPREVEEILVAHPAVAAVAVVGQPHPRLGQVPVAFLQLERAAVRASDEAVIEELRRRCEAALAAAKRPVRFELVEQVPAGPSGKPLRRELRDRLAGG